MAGSQDDIETMRIEKLVWLPPVRSPTQLPVEGVCDGTLCFVEGPEDDGAEEVWEFRDGAWRVIDNL